MDVDEPVNDLIDLRNNMLDHLSQRTDVYFKSQQINDPDLTVVERRQIAESLVDKNPGCFLSRFGKYLLENHLDYFSELAHDDYEVNYYLQDLRRKFSFTDKKSTIRNRRLEALRRLDTEGEYFSDDQMRKRNPVMFEQLVGQYLTDEEKQCLKTNKPETESFLGYLLNAIEEREIEEQLKRETVEEEEESDSDADVDSKNSDSKWQSVKLWGENVSSEIKCKGKRNKKNCAITNNEKTLLLNEFRSHVYSEFLDGRDQEFDYSKVDSNHDYDDLEMLEIDQQDKYFDSETPEILSRGDASSDSSLSFDPPKSLIQKMEDLGK